MKKNLVQFAALVFLIIVLETMVLLISCEAAGKMVLVSTDGVKKSKYGQLLNLVFTEAFNRLGYKLQYNSYPAARASSLSDSGKVDGEISRVYSYQDTHPNVIRVDEVIYTTDFTAFAAKPGIVLNGWKSLNNTTYRVEYRRGVKLSKSELSKFIAKSLLSNVTSVEQGLKKLIKGRTDLYVDVGPTVLDAMKRMDTAEFDVSVVYKAGVMQKVNTYAYLHRKHAALIPKLIKVLKAMKRERLFDRYQKIVYGQKTK